MASAYDPPQYDPNDKGAPYSPLQLEAGATLLARNGSVPPQPVNNGIEPIPLSAAVDDFKSQAFLAKMYDTIQYNADNSIITDTTVGNIWQMGGTSCPALTDAVPSAYIADLNAIETNQWNGDLTPFFTDAGWTNFLTLTADLYLGKTDTLTGRYYVTRTFQDNGKFAQTFSVTQSYCGQTNAFIESAYNANNNYLGDTFTDQNNLVTADYTEVNLDTQGFGTDLQNLGQLIDLANIDNFGFPFALLQQISNVGGIVTPVIIALTLAGVNENIVLDLNNPDLVVTDSMQKNMYLALQLIQGDDLIQILKILGVTTPNINTMADLLNPVKIFPNSFSTITAPTCNGLRAVYLNTDGAVNSSLETSLPGVALGNLVRLSKIIPSDQALADVATSVSLQQITDIRNMTLPELAASFLGIETNKGLPDVNAMLTPISTYAESYYDTNMAKGSGENGTILTTDLIGTAVGNVHAEKLSNSIALINGLSGSNFINLQTIYTNMYDTIRLTPGATLGNCSMVYLVGPPPVYQVTISGSGSVGGGTYTGNTAPEAIQAAFDSGLVPSGISACSGTVSQNSSTCTALNDNFDAMADKVILEAELQNDANMLIKDFSPWPRNKSSVYTLIGALNAYGLETKVGGTAEFIEQITDVNNADADIRLGMQSVIGSLREGRTDLSTNSAGAGKANRVSANPATPPPQAELSSSTYTSAEARALIIT